jgi:hypothetical protein
MITPQRFSLSSVAASSGARDSGYGGLGPVQVRVPVLPSRGMPGQMSLPLAMPATTAARQRLRTG